MLALKAGTALALCLFAGSAWADGKPTYGTMGRRSVGMDKSVKPGDDFFSYVNGNWYKTAVIPPDRSTTGSFPGSAHPQRKAHEGDRGRARCQAYDQLTDEEKKLRDLYDAFKDQKQIEGAAWRPRRKISTTSPA